MAYNPENLIVLRYSPNRCYTTLSLLRENKDVTIDGDNWKYRDITCKIGCCFDSEYHEAVIGVYDRLNLQHLEDMKNTSKEVTTTFDYNED
jgi:hypothetical protein